MSTQPTEPLPSAAVKRADNLVRDSRKWPVVFIIPLLAVVFPVRLAQWYQLKREFPSLVSSEVSSEPGLAEEFKEALSYLWVASLIWPVAGLAVLIYVAFSRH